MNRLIQGVLVLMLLVGTSGAALAEDAAKIYGTKCAMCHGKDGKGNPGMSKKFGADALNLVDKASLAKTDEEWIKITLEGAGTPSASKSKPMPAFKGKVSDASTKALVAYIRSLGPKK